MTADAQDKALQAFREEINEIADIRQRLEQLSRRHPDDGTCLRAIWFADYNMRRLAYRVSKAYSALTGGVQ